MFATEGKPTHVPLPFWLAVIWGVFSIGMFVTLIGYGAGTCDWFWRTGISTRPGGLLITSAVFLFCSFATTLVLVKNLYSTYRTELMIFLVTCELVFLATGFAFFAREGTDGASRDRRNECETLIDMSPTYRDWMNTHVLKNSTLSSWVLDDYIDDRTKNPGNIIMGTYIIWALLAIGLFYFLATWESGSEVLYSSMSLREHSHI
jgi:hypothetical protein